MYLESRMVTERAVRHFVGTHTLAARLVSIVNFFTLLLCLLMDMLNTPSEIRITVNNGHGKFPSGGCVPVPLPDSFSLRY